MSKSQHSARAGRRPTIHEVAHLAGVSIGTVSRVIGGGASVAPDTRVRVQRAMASIGYQPNAAARSMRTNVTKTVGLLVPDIQSPTFVQVAVGVERVLGEAGFMLLIGSSTRSCKKEIAFLQTARQRQMDGLIVSLSDETAKQSVLELSLAGVPIVILDRDIPVEADVVFSEHANAMQQAVTHLLTLGHRHIGYVGPTQKIRPGRERVLGYRQAYSRAAITVREELLRTGMQNTGYGESETAELMRLATPPTALIGGSSDIFYGMLRTLRRLDVQIPEQVSLIGVDEHLLADVISPPITVIARDMIQTGEEAGRMLLDRIADPGRSPRQINLRSEIVLRQSTAPPAPDTL